MSERDDSVYVNDMLDSITAIKGFISGLDYPAFLGDRKTYSATVRELEVIGEASGKISDTLKAQHPDIDWRRSRISETYLPMNISTLTAKSSGTLFKTSLSH